ncbi:hypothetical protein HY488_01760 [Candidatus Woesearchaeota archaeon]|nr:hypothetical protein [Candidatus Woesearchaeota archaeon]
MLKQNKRGAELTLNVIVIAAIVLFVLVVLLLIFTGRIGGFQKETAKCETQGGVCTLGACPENARQVSTLVCDLNSDGDSKDGPGVDGVCCVSV